MNKGVTVFEQTVPGKAGTKRRREARGDPENVDGYLGPWASYEDEVKVSKPTEVSPHCQLRQLLSLIVSVSRGIASPSTDSIRNSLPCWRSSLDTSRSRRTRMRLLRRRPYYTVSGR